MPRLLARPKAFATRLWATDAPLTATGFLMLGALVAALAGLWLDPRSITGAPAWLKPAKFAVSTAVYALTLAWVFTFIPEWRATRRVVGRTTAVVLSLEVAIIFAQAWRGTASHFNVGTPLDAALFAVMGVAIVGQTLTSVAAAAALWRQRVEDAALGWALRLGLSITIAGAASGALMTAPTAAQLADARATSHLALAGAHTVGAPDGGPGLPGTGWSTTHGDLRVPHFLGLHALQALPLLAIGLRRRRRPEQVRGRVVIVAAVSYAALFVALGVQALRGQSVVDPDMQTIGLLGAWALATAAGVWLATARRLATRVVTLRSAE